MKKSIVALLAASAVVALTGAGASAVGDFTLKGKLENVAGSTMTVRVANAKAGCDINVKVKDQTEEAYNTSNDDDTDWYNFGYTDNTVALGNVKLGAKTSGSTAIKLPGKAGYYELLGIVKLTKLSCVPVAGTTVSQWFKIGVPTYVAGYEGDKVQTIDRQLGTYTYQLSGQVRTGDSNDKLKGGVGVELWFVNADNSRWVKAKTTKTNIFGEFKFEGVYDTDAHYNHSFQIRTVRDAKFYPEMGPGYGIVTGDLDGFDFDNFHSN